MQLWGGMRIRPNSLNNRSTYVRVNVYYYIVMFRRSGIVYMNIDFKKLFNCLIDKNIIVRTVNVLKINFYIRLFAICKTCSLVKITLKKNLNIQIS